MSYVLKHSEKSARQQKAFLVKHKEIHYCKPALILPALQVGFKGSQIKGVCEKTENSLSNSAQSDC